MKRRMRLALLPLVLDVLSGCGSDFHDCQVQHDDGIASGTLAGVALDGATVNAWSDLVIIGGRGLVVRVDLPRAVGTYDLHDEHANLSRDDGVTLEPLSGSLVVTEAHDDACGPDTCKTLVADITTGADVLHVRYQESMIETTCATGSGCQGGWPSPGNP